MFLDSLNCYHINGRNGGLFVFFPEIGQVIFYKEKEPAKILKYDTLDFSDDTHWITFKNCSSVPEEELGEKLSLGASIKRSMQKLAKGSNPNICFVAENNSENFNTFFKKERGIDKYDLLAKKETIDYLLVIKLSQSEKHTSEPEIRILRIDWAKKIIKYYTSYC